jgi:hypothetical protein
MLVQRRNQPHLWVHADLEAKFRIAEADLGRTILLGNVKAPNGVYLAAWRSDASTRYLWDLSFHGGSTASNPDTGPLTHSRGVGADLLFYGADVLAACARAGIVINYVKGERWHVQLPNYTRYPIIRTNALATNGLGAPIAPTEEQEDEDMANHILIRNTARGDFIVDPLGGRCKHVGNPFLLNKLKAAGQEILTVVDAEIDQMMKMCLGETFVYPPSNGYWVNPVLAKG